MNMKIRELAAWFGALRLGWSGRIGLALSALSLVGYFVLIEPGSQRLDELQRQAEILRLQGAGKNKPERVRTADEQLVEFYRFFPDDKAFVDWLTQVAAIAQASGLSLDQGEYEAEPEMGGKLVRYQVTLPLHGDYRQIRRFLGDLSEEMPALALEQVQFERPKIGDTMVNARIRLAIFMQAST